MALLHCPLLMKLATPFNPSIKCEKDKKFLMMSFFVYRKRRMRESLKKQSSRSVFFVACSWTVLKGQYRAIDS
jgi:hypothetical protein